jgi:hypothetical protein
VPVGTKTISPSIPYSYDKPREGGEAKREQGPFPGCGKNPPDHIKQREERMKNEEEDV